jgi:hypothetical protein
MAKERYKVVVRSVEITIAHRQLFVAQTNKAGWNRSDSGRCYDNGTLDDRS